MKVRLKIATLTQVAAGARAKVLISSEWQSWLAEHLIDKPAEHAGHGNEYLEAIRQKIFRHARIVCVAGNYVLQVLPSNERVLNDRWLNDIAASHASCKIAFVAIVLHPDCFTHARGLIRKR